MYDSAKCFISYCGDDVSQDAINEIITDLRILAKSRIHFYYDKENKAGDDLKAFMDKIKICDSVVVICSPAYKKKLAIDGENVKYEFDLIKERIEKIEEIETSYVSSSSLSEAEFAIIPIIVSYAENKLDSNESYPDFFRKRPNLVYKRYTYFSKKTETQIKSVEERSGEKHSKQDKLLIKIGENSKLLKKDNLSIIKTIIAKTIAINIQRLIDNPSVEIKAKIGKLIDNTKAEHVGVLGWTFCKTKFYHDLKNQNRTVFVGRKGSGKTQTILQYYFENQENFKGHINIDANYIGVERIYNELRSLKENINDKMVKRYASTISDIEQIFTYEEFLRYTWHGFIYLCSIYRIIRESIIGHLEASQKRRFTDAKSFFLNRFPTIKNEIKKEEPDSKISQNVLTALYDYAFHECLDFYNNIVFSNNPNTYSELMAQIHILNKLENYIEKLLTKKGLKSFTNTLSCCKRRIFLSLDGFDNLQEEKKGRRYFPDGKQDHSGVSDFEDRWITTLVDVISKIKNAQNGECVLTGQIEICLMVPFDRYMQITSKKRDGFVYHDLLTSAIYKGSDLYDMFLKRLWVIFVDNSSEPRPVLSTDADRNEVQEKIFKTIKKVTTKIEVKLKDKHSVYFPLFLYILRYSFWRPRDIIDHIRAIFSTILYSENNIGEITVEQIKESVHLCSKKIVLKIVQEFKELWENVDECFKKFTRMDAVTSYSEFALFVKNTNFNIKRVNCDNPYSNVDDIIKFLYELGVIGLLLSQKNQKRIHSKFPQHQVFYSGHRPLAALGEEIFTENHIFINPTFVSFYNIKIETNEILGINDFKKLNHIDSLIDYDYLNSPV